MKRILLDSSEILKRFDELMTNPYEMCGSYIIKNNKFVAKNCYKGKLDNGRYICERDINNITQITYHTHIFNTPGYPSYEDITTLIDEDKTIDIIYTCWGIWVVSLNSNVNKKELAILFKKENNPFNNGLDREKKYSVTIYNAIQKFINALVLCNYNVDFYTWEQRNPIYINISDSLYNKLNN